jgi:hypothetical protein
MVKRYYSYSRLLVYISVAVFHLALAVQANSQTNVYVRVRSGDCGLTKLRVRLEGIQQLPRTVLFSIRSEEASRRELENTKLELDNGEYNWTGLLPIGDFKGKVVLSNGQSLETNFTNRRILLRFLNAQSALIQIRNGNITPAEAATEMQRTRRDIYIDQISPTTDRLQLLLIGSGNTLAEQYIGAPISSWSPSVPDGTYKLVIIEYDDAHSKCSVRDKRS